LRQRLFDLVPLLPKPTGTHSLKGLEDLIESGQAPVQQKRKDSFDVFLSYRGTHAQAAQRLVDESLQEHGKRVRIIRTEICRILMKCCRCSAGGRFFAESLIPSRPRASFGCYGRMTISH